GGLSTKFKKNNGNHNSSNNATSNDIKTDHNKSAPHTLTSDQYQRLVTLLSDTGNASQAHASVASYDKQLCHITDLNLSVLHPNGTVEQVKQIGNYNLGNNLIIKDMLVVLGYYVSLLSIHKLSKDNKVIVSFNDSKCKIQDLTQKFLMGTGSEKGGLYFFDESKRVNNSNIKCCHMILITKDPQYATETEVLEGIQGTALNDDDYDSEGEDIEYFGQLFESSKPIVGQNVRRSSRKASMPFKYKDYVLNKNVKYGLDKVVTYSLLSIEIYVFTTSINKIHEPSTYAEAVKYKANGDIERFKARLVAKRFNQREGIGYEETFSPVVKIVTMICIRSIAVMNKWPLFQLDVNNAFLSGELKEDVYMSTPKGYSDKDDKKVCKLVKCLYRLKQAPRKYNETLTSVPIDNGFV
ncbi:ribonuclease H-like domain-containing protein, partial [Tanacetum coccineum]